MYVKTNNLHSYARNTITRKPSNSKVLLIATMIALYPALSSVAIAATTENAAVSNAAKPNKVIKLKEIKKRYQRLLIGERNIASAMSVIGKTQIKRASGAESIYSILKQTPSVNEYQQNIGPGTPVLTVRGVRISQLAQTLDGIPMTDLLNGGQGAYLNSNVGSQVSMGQIEGIHVYPGVAPPDRGGFATVGGTIDYTTKRPTNHKYADIFTKIGSFATDTYGFDANSGSIPGTNGLKIYTRLSQTQTAGYIQNTPARYTDFMLAFDKPYNEGLSKVTGTVIYNTGNGYLISAPVATAEQDKNGIFYNYPLSESSLQEKNKFLTAIIGDSNYINSHVVIGAKAFYIYKSSKSLGFLAAKYLPASYPYQVNFNNAFSAYGALPPIAAAPGQIPRTYDPLATFGSYAAGQAANIVVNHNTTIGITPKINIFLPHNDITIGGLIAEETSTGDGNFIYGSLNMPMEYGFNDLASPDSKVQRTIYSGYISDKVNLIHNRLHIEPGVTITGVNSSNYVAGSYATPPDFTYTLQNYLKEVLPYLGVSYDISHQVIAYASYGKGARFAPVIDYTQNTAANTPSNTAPNPETVNAYETGVRYVGKHLYLNFDGFLQNMHDIFSYYIKYTSSGPTQFHGNTGGEQMKGLEFSGKYQINPDWTVSGQLSYVDAHYTKSFFALDTPFQGQYGYVYAGDPLIAVPNWLGGLSIAYHHHNFNASLSENYTGPQVTSDNISENNPDPYLDGATTPDTSRKLDPYFLTNIQASYKIPVHEDHLSSVTVSLNVDNLLNNNYFLHLYRSYKEVDGGAEGSQYNQAYPGMPRFIEVGLSGRFS